MGRMAQGLRASGARGRGVPTGVGPTTGRGTSNPTQRNVVSTGLSSVASAAIGNDKIEVDSTPRLALDGRSNLYNVYQAGRIIGQIEESRNGSYTGLVSGYTASSRTDRNSALNDVVIKRNEKRALGAIRRSALFRGNDVENKLKAQVASEGNILKGKWVKTSSNEYRARTEDGTYIVRYNKSKGAGLNTISLFKDGSSKSIEIGRQYTSRGSGAEELRSRANKIFGIDF